MWPARNGRPGCPRRPNAPKGVVMLPPSGYS
jgi:hypothetical protein